LDQVLAPYDRSLTEFTDDERASWARFIVANLRLEGLSEADEVFIHADALYAESLEHALKGCVSEIHAVAFEEDPSVEIDGFPEDGPF
jgi:hypothetical protein